MIGVRRLACRGIRGSAAAEVLNELKAKLRQAGPEAAALSHSSRKKAVLRWTSAPPPSRWATDCLPPGGRTSPDVPAAPFLRELC